MSMAETFSLQFALKSRMKPTKFGILLEFRTKEKRGLLEKREKRGLFQFLAFEEEETETKYILSF